MYPPAGRTKTALCAGAGEALKAFYTHAVSCPPAAGQKFPITPRSLLIPATAGFPGATCYIMRLSFSPPSSSLSGCQSPRETTFPSHCFCASSNLVMSCFEHWNSDTCFRLFPATLFPRFRFPWLFPELSMLLAARSARVSVAEGSICGLHSPPLGPRVCDMSCERESLVASVSIFFLLAARLVCTVFFPSSFLGYHSALQSPTIHHQNSPPIPRFQPRGPPSMSESSQGFAELSSCPLVISTSHGIFSRGNSPVLPFFLFGRRATLSAPLASISFQGSVPRARVVALAFFLGARSHNIRPPPSLLWSQQQGRRKLGRCTRLFGRHRAMVIMVAPLITQSSSRRAVHFLHLRWCLWDPITPLPRGPISRPSLGTRERGRRQFVCVIVCAERGAAPGA